MDASIQERSAATEPARSAAPPTRRLGAERKLGRIDIHEDLIAGGKAWGELEALCPATIYQTRKFLLPWLATHGLADGVTPMIVVAHTSDGAPAALLPFGVQKYGPVKVARFLGGADSNSNIGLFRPDIAFEADDLISLLRAAAAKTRLKPDAFVLSNQPATHAGKKNPLDIFPNQSSASFCHHSQLDVDPAAFFARRLSKDTTKKLRKKRKRLESMGALAYVRAQSASDVARILDVFFALKVDRLRQKHISTAYEHPQARSYLERACCPRPDRAPSIDLHALMLDDRIIAVFGGAVHNDHLSLMFNAFDFDVEIAVQLDVVDARCEAGSFEI